MSYSDKLKRILVIKQTGYMGHNILFFNHSSTEQHGK